MKITAILLAGGKGKRMHSRNPKVLYKVSGKPLIFYSLKLLSQLPFDDIQVVIGYRKALVKSAVLSISKKLRLRQKVGFAVQTKMLGTGNAVAIALREVANKITDVLVLNGDDSCFYSPQTIKKVLALHTKARSDMTFVTLKLKNPTGLGRIVRDKSGKVVRIIEEKAATSAQKKINEVNDGCYVFKTSWLRRFIGKIPLSAAGEYYLTDLVAIGGKFGARIETFTLDKTNEWVGINTKEELARARELMTGLNAQARAKI